MRWKTNQVIFYKRNPKSRGGPTMASKTMTITMTLRMMVMQPRSQGSFLPALRSERERDPGKRWSRGSRTKLILREESFVSHCFCLVYSQRSRHAVIATAR